MANVSENTITAPLPRGVVEVRPRAIAHLAAAAAIAVPGVVGLVDHLATAESVPPLAVNTLHAGVDVQIVNGMATLEIYVVLAYGASLADVAQQIETAARAAVEYALGQPIGSVAVRVQAVR